MSRGARGRPARAGSPRRTALALVTAGVVLVAVCLLALAVGRFDVPYGHVVRILAAQVSMGTPDTGGAERDVVVLVRLPRVLLALVVGGGLAIAGAALQAAFRNPLVSPEIIGVSSGASLGGALAILLGLGSVFLVVGAFAFGMLALVVLLAVTLSREGTPMLMVVLGGVVTGSFFSALVSLVTYVADPYTELPAIVFWLLGSVATASYTKVLVVLVPVAVGAGALLLLRWRVNVLSLGDEDAKGLGVRPGALRWVVLVSAALLVAGTVAVSGVVSWVGLVIPHLARMWVGPDHRVLLPVSFLVGAGYVVAIDTLARTLTPGEIPLGILTALVGAPAFFVLLRRNRDRVWDSA